VLIHQGRLIFYGAVTVGEQIHAVYGEYDESSIGTITLDVPYNNYFLQMISMDDAIIAVMRTNYLMDYQIRKTIYTEDDILYVID
jgi:glutathione peroxidase-family protein